jgi:Zn-dependent oligopeptidase
LGQVLDSFAADYRDPSKNSGGNSVQIIAKLATEGTRYRRQLSFGLMDLTLHTQIRDNNAKETLPLPTKHSATFSSAAPDTASFTGHLMHYDAG